MEKEREKLSDSSKIVMFHGKTDLDIPADRVLENNIGRLSKVVLMGYDHDDNFYCAMSIGSVAEVNLLVDRFKQYLLNSFEED